MSAAASTNDFRACGYLGRGDVAMWLRELADALVDDGDLVFDFDATPCSIAMPSGLRMTARRTMVGRHAAGVGIGLRWESPVAIASPPHDLPPVRWEDTPTTFGED